MQANKEAQELWLELKEYGDMPELSKLLNVSTRRVTQIVESGTGSVCQIATIHKFYLKKKEMLNVLKSTENE